jgi:FlaA1/EpsC-like NDP-sugar epimerase
MIQRIQSVWLLVASIVTFLTLKFSFYSGTYLPDNQYHQLNATENILLMITTIALGVLTLITIFLYKTRVIQLRLCIVAILLDLILLFLYYRALQNFSRGEYAITAASHLLIIAALVLAASGINKDEKLIKDSDRLR